MVVGGELWRRRGSVDGEEGAAGILRRSEWAHRLRDDATMTTVAEARAERLRWRQNRSSKLSWPAAKNSKYDELTRRGKKWVAALGCGEECAPGASFYRSLGALGRRGDVEVVRRRLRDRG